MEIDALREKHPEFSFESFEIDQQKKTLTITYHFRLFPDIVFTPTISVPTPKTQNISELETLVFNLGMIEALSYWKASCSPFFVVKAGALDKKQIAWWKDVYFNGLGEFFYKNKIDFRAPDFLTIVSKNNKQITFSKEKKATNGDLALIGGGKDSAVVAQLLNTLHHPKNALLLNPTPAALSIAATAGYKNPLIVKRIIDPKLLELNQIGYLNGHTPFSAYLAFLGTLVAAVYGFENVIVANERSANYGNKEYLGLTLNHQYSKSYTFEKKFRDYSKKYLDNKINYFSFLRPLYELQIAKLFSKYTQYHMKFISCNVNRGKSWCGNCAKCVFAYICLAPYIEEKTLIEIFGTNVLLRPQNLHYICELLGIGRYKPFDCVGTPEETKVALTLYFKMRPLSEVHYLQTRLPSFTMATSAEINTIMQGWENDAFLPSPYIEVVKSNLN